MTITLSLEVEAGASMEEISLILSQYGAEVCVDGDSVSGNFDKSNAYFVFRRCEGAEEVVAEGVCADWLVGVRGAFHCLAGRALEEFGDVRGFLVFLSERVGCKFVLSFQYESLYAIRDDGGLRFFNDLL